VTTGCFHICYFKNIEKGGRRFVNIANKISHPVRFFVLWTIISFVNYYNTSGSHGQDIERSGEGSRNEFIGICRTWAVRICQRIFVNWGKAMRQGMNVNA
jgi:hypothetical protein